MQDVAGDERQSHKEAQAEIAQLAEALSQARERLDALRDKITGRRVALAAAEREHEASLRDQTRRDEERAKLLAQGDARRAAVEKLRGETEDNLAAVEEEAASLTSAREALDEKRGAYRTLEIRRVALQQGLRDMLEKLEEAQKKQEVMTDRAHRAEVQSQRLQADLENMIGRIWDNYEMTYAGAREFASPDFDATQAGVRIEGMRREIRAMGSVNTAAIEDYRAIGERHASMSAQRNDLVRAREDLLGIVEELTQRMEAQFTEQFAILGANFNQTFRALFGGGRAELRLTDEKNPLTCGIDIVAQPPGKRLQLLSLLSGGERALTAIAILFAMLKAKPTPFCILDEIEAALDDSNIANFARYLADYSRNTQFIVVTHRKGTMECCDALYGISMEEKGVSSMVSVELTALDALQSIG
jgi:chromosome segregation protein